MQDVKKVDIESQRNQKRNRRRRKNMTGYYVLVAVLAAGIAAALSVTLLFNVHEVVISGMSGSGYTEEDIVRSSGIVRGDNLVRMKTDRIRETMLNDLLYIDDVQITRSFPNKVLIDITPSKGCAYVECRGGYMLVSENWRIIGHAEQPEDRNLIVVKGFDCESNEEKTTMTSTDPDKNTALKNIMDEIKNQNIKNMVSIDLTDKYDVVLDYDNRIRIKIEKPNDIEYKLRYAYKIITDELRENKNGYLIYRNSLGYSYVSDEEYNRINGGSGFSSAVPAPENPPADMINPDVSAAVSGNIQPAGQAPQAVFTEAETVPAPVTEHAGW